MKTIFAIMVCLFPLAAMSAGPEACDGALESGRYLKYLHCLGEKNDMISLQRRATALSFLGREGQAQLLMTQSEGESTDATHIDTAAVSAFKRMDAVDELVRLAGSHRVIMLNEAHHNARHRVFALELAAALRKSGFTHLAMEGLNVEAAPFKNGYATLKDPISGFYTAEPQFSNFIRQAVALGFTLVPYEAGAMRTVEEREQGQARNLSDFLKAHPGAKVLVYAGYGHISERDTARGKGWMAKYFRLYTGIDPLTIDQDGGTGHTPADQSDETWRAVVHRVGNNPAVFKNQDGAWLVSKAYEGKVDLTVFHPATKLIDGRPDWLLKNRVRHLVETPKSHGAMVIRAVMPNEINGVPVDQVLIDDHQSRAVLFLPKGNYRIESETLESGIVDMYEVAL